MPTYRLVAKIELEQQPDPTFLVRSPAVGVADGVPAEGVYLNPTETFLTLTILNRRYLVQLPRNVRGVVTERMIEDTCMPVGYGQPLFRLSQAAAPSAEQQRAASATAEASGDSDLIPIPSPSDGVFYRKPTPDSPPYAEEGTAVSNGTVLGLVEVMKSFNQITYGGPGLPDSGIVARVLVSDAVEVAFGQPLFLVKPS